MEGAVVVEAGAVGGAGLDSPAPAGDGVAGGFDAAVEAVLCCGAAGGAGVVVAAEGVEGAAGVVDLDAAGAALGWIEI